MKHFGELRKYDGWRNININTAQLGCIEWLKQKFIDKKTKKILLYSGWRNMSMALGCIWWFIKMIENIWATCRQVYKATENYCITDDLTSVHCHCHCHSISAKQRVFPTKDNPTNAINAAIFPPNEKESSWSQPTFTLCVWKERSDQAGRGHLGGLTMTQQQ